jgi:hypothetical protein
VLRPFACDGRPLVAEAIEERMANMGDKSPKSKEKGAKQKDASNKKDAAKAKAKQEKPVQTFKKK